MRPPSNKLQHLINSLNSSERRYIKVAANQQGAKRYKQLFELIEKQEIYDESEIIKEIYGENPLSRKFPELKRYLFDFVLDSLSSYDAEHSAQLRIKSKLKQLVVLFKRGHYESCIEVLERIKTLALLYDDYLSLIECLRWERQIAYARMDVIFFDKSLDRLDAEEKTYLSILENISAYRNLFFKLYISIRSIAFVRTEDKIKYMQSLREHPLMVGPEEAQSFTALINYYRILNLYYYSMLDMKQFNSSGYEMLRVMETRPQIFEEDPTEYISALSNYTLSCGLLDQYDEVRNSLKKFKTITIRTLDDQVKTHLIYYSYLFSLCIYTGEFKQGLAALEEHMIESKKYENSRFFERGSLYFYYCYIYFGSGDFETSLDWLNKWLNLPKSLERQDLQSLARIISLLIHYEMGNILLLEPLVKNTKSYLQRREKLLGYERAVLQFVRDVSKLKDTRRWSSAFKTLLEHLRALEEIPTENAMLKYFDIIAWLESKLDHVSFEVAIKNRLAKKAIKL
jgi:hypothetical protein